MDEHNELLEIMQSGDLDFAFSEYNKLCDKAKSFFFNYVLIQSNNYRYFEAINGYEIFNRKLTPIEQIFYIAFRLYTADFARDFDVKTEVPLSLLLSEEITTQKEVVCNDTKYIIDFVIDFSRKSIPGFDRKRLPGNEYIHPKLKNLKYAVEVDGYDYHSSKKQMEYDYIRENNLKKCGYTVIRFTGSQVYKKPLSCVDTLVNIIVSDIKNRE